MAKIGEGQMSARGLILLGHGSKLPYFVDVMEFHKERIEKMRIFSEVKIAYISMKPEIREIIEGMKSDEVYIVPLFISHGAHTEELPTLLGLEGKKGEFEGVKIFICEPIGRDELITYAIINSVIAEMEGKA
jgi:sirohydrochlorin ferrochelatase